ncbi:hypothetical protein [Pseudobdellovibrio exovorus]|uniref:Lipoprotein n=1 Tax=Pseudobdellovibrio exovorus JSS TaxID=1184267 RepID=M4V708_9BACT|nr:hypothetical protein [Pseudobdellovibrio exovorus]AGH95172.1 hypothetical protein A11Q_956 [Pseudobdellovibrio exovorus JSS]
MKKLFVLANLLLLTACDPFEGNLSVKYAFLVKGKANAVVAAGDHSAKLDFDGKKKITINLKQNGKKQKIELNLNNKLNLPNNGSFELTAADLGGQDFSSRGTVQTQTRDSELRREYESCSYQRREHVCYPTKNGVVCRDEYRTVYGRRPVEFIDRTTYQQLAVNFIHANGALLADFNGDKQSTERLYRYQGHCF